MDALQIFKDLGSRHLGLNFDDARHIFHNTDNWAIAPQPAGILFPEYYDILVNWRTPILAAALYIIVVVALNPKQGKVSRVVAADNAAKATAVGDNKQDLSQSTPFITALVFVHNTILCLYSAWTFHGMFFAWKKSFETHSFMDAICDTDGTFWDSLGYYAYYFYISKY
ncbi:hypothetical protein BGZ99_000432, partial [Dissophora globulifera]